MDSSRSKCLRFTRVLLSRAFHSRREILSAGNVNAVRDGHRTFVSCGGFSAISCGESRSFHSQAAYAWGRLKHVDSSAGMQNACQAWFALAARFGQEVIREAHLALKVTEHSMSSFKIDVTAHGQRAWERMYGQCAWRKLYVQNGFRKPLLPPFNVNVRAVSLAFARSHISLGLLAVAVGSLNQCVAEAQQSHGSAPLYSQTQVSPSILSSVVYSILEIVGLVSRGLYLLVLFMPAILTAPFANSFGGQFRQAWLQLVHHTLELAGAAFIKWGQWAATRPDLFPRDLCLELSKLHTKAPAHKYSHTLQTVEKAFGRKLHDIFEEFEEEPVASGSIAQVHKATLRFGYPGQKSKPMLVAVKVRHPGVGEVIRRDFVIIKGIAGLSTFVPGLKWLRLDESVQQFAVFMLTQVDLAREAAHLSRFLYNFRQWKDVSFPRPLYPLVHPAVLVETYEQGESVSRFVELSEKSTISSALAHIGTHTLLKMLLVDNFIHADMHPGNILVRVKKKRMHPAKRFFPTRPHVVFLDVGMTAELSNNDRINLLDFFKAVARRDGQTAAECALKFSKNQSCPNPAAFIKEVESSFKLWGSEEGEDIHPGDCVQDLLEQVRRHRVNVDGDVCTVMVTTMVLEGWQRKLDPDYNIMQTLQTLLFKRDLASSLSYTINGIMAP
eukprot:c21999_g1_i2 orf=321-2324(+)